VILRWMIMRTRPPTLGKLSKQFEKPVSDPRNPARANCIGRGMRLAMT
jgi:hypothetical protein